MAANPQITGYIRTPDHRLRVFVSSTMAELAEERQAASRAIGNLHVSPILFELGARPHPSRELYRAYLQQSDVFIGIYGAHYGWINPSMTISGIEDEYDLSADKPRLIYLKETDQREPRLTALLDRITAEGSVSYKRFSTADELGCLIEDDLAVLLSERFHGALTPGDAVPEFDPPPPPHVQYVSTADGVSIAFYTMGEGPPVLSLMLPFSHLEAEWRTALLRRLYINAARRNTLIRLDHRGFGLSDRDVSDYSVDRLVLDIEAVVDRLGVEQLGVCAVGFAGIPALAFAARHSGLVSHFIQGTPAVSGTDFMNERLSKLYELLEVDWDLAKDTIVRSFNPDANERTKCDIVNLVTASIDGTNMRRFLADMQQWDAVADARAMSTPTILIHRDNPNANLSATRRVASLIKNSRVTFSNTDDFQAAFSAQELQARALLGRPLGPTKK